LNDGIEIDTREDYTRIHRGWSECQIDFLTCMQADAGSANDIFKCALTKHRSALPGL
jgi:hypothetical protein